MKIVNKIIEYGLYALVFLLPLQTRWIIKQGYLNGWPYEFGTLSVYAVDILLVVLLGLQAFKYFYALKQSDDAENKLPIHWWLLAIFEFITFVSIFVAPDKIIAVYKYLYLLLAIGVFWLVLSAEYKKEKLILVFISSTILQALFGVWQFLSQHTFANKWLGLAVHPIQEAGTSIIIDGIGERVLRAYGTLDHPNIFGGLMMLALLLLFLNNPPLPSLYKREGRGRSVAVNIIYGFCLIALLVGLFFSFSRAAWISFFAGSSSLLIVAFFKKDKAFLKFLFLNLAIFLLVFSALTFQYKDLVFSRMSADVYTEVKSVDERLEGNKISYGIIKDNWWLGAGVGNYGVAVQNKFSNLNYQLYQPVHNVYLLVASELGIMGITALILFIFYILTYIKRAGNIYKTTIIISILVLFIFDHWLFSLHYGIIMLFIVLGACIKGEKN